MRLGFLRFGVEATRSSPHTSLTKQNNLRKYHRVQRMMNIKIAKAIRTLSYEASCVLAGVRPIRLAIEEKIRTYKATQNNIEYDVPLKVRYWPHPTEIPLIRAPTEILHNVINIFTDGSKIGGDDRSCCSHNQG